MSDAFQDRVNLDAYPMADFSSKSRTFQFKTETVRVDIGRCSGYWTLADGRKCISEHTADKQSNLYETYFFSSCGLGDKLYYLPIVGPGVDYCVM